MHKRVRPETLHYITLHYTTLAVLSLVRRTTAIAGPEGVVTMNGPRAGGSEIQLLTEEHSKPRGPTVHDSSVTEDQLVEGRGGGALTSGGRGGQWRRKRPDGALLDCLAK